MGKQTGQTCGSTNPGSSANAPCKQPASHGTSTNHGNGFSEWKSGGKTK